MYWFFIYWLLSGTLMAYWVYRDYDTIIEEYPVMDMLGKKGLIILQILAGFITFPWVVKSKLYIRYYEYKLHKKEAENKKLWQKYFATKLKHYQIPIIKGTAKELGISEQEVLHTLTELGLMLCVMASESDQIGDVMNNLNKHGNEYRNLLKIIELQYKYYKAGEQKENS